MAGVMIGIELAVDGTPVVKECLARKLLVNCTHSTVIRLLAGDEPDRGAGRRRLRHSGRRDPQAAAAGVVGRIEDRRCYAGGRRGPPMPFWGSSSVLIDESGKPLMRHVLTLFELTADEIQRIFALTKELKDKFLAGFREPILPGRVHGAAVREAVAADARQLRGGDGPSGRHDAVPGPGRRLGQTRVGGRLCAGAQPVRRCGRLPRQQPRAASRSSPSTARAR